MSSKLIKIIIRNGQLKVGVQTSYKNKHTHTPHTHTKKKTVKLYMIRLSYCETSVKVLKQAK